MKLFHHLVQHLNLKLKLLIDDIVELQDLEEGEEEKSINFDQID